MSAEYIFNLDIEGIEKPLMAMHDGSEGFGTYYGTGIEVITSILEEQQIDLNGKSLDDIQVTIVRDDNTIFSGTLQDYVDTMPDDHHYSIKDGKLDVQFDPLPEGDPNRIFEVHMCEDTAEQPVCDPIIGRYTP